MDALTAAPGLLGHAVGYALASAGYATPQLLPLATPCEGWDLRTLLLHVSDSLGVLAGALRAGQVGPGPPRPTSPPPRPTPSPACAARRVTSSGPAPPRVRKSASSPSPTAS